MCEPEGWCSFPDRGCASRRRFGRWSGDDRADRCVPPTVTDDGGSTTTAPASSDDAPSSTTTDAPVREPSTGVVDDDGGSSTGVDPDAPVLWLRFDEPSFDGIVLDAAASHHAMCTPGACPTPRPGVIGGAGAFDGIDDVLNIADHPDFHTEQALTLALWVTMDPAQVGYRSLLAKPLAANDYLDSWELGRNENGRPTANVSAVPGATVDVIADATLGETWVHLAVTWDGGILRLYVDGEERDSAEVDTIIFTDAIVYVGASWDNGVVDNFLLGGLDEVQVWRRALAADEVAALADVQ